MLADCKLSTKGCLQMCVEGLLENLKKYPEVIFLILLSTIHANNLTFIKDKRSTWMCMQKLGSSHPHLTLLIVPYLLSIHPFLDLPEPDVEDPACILLFSNQI